MTFTEIAKMSDSEAREYLESIRWKNGVRCAHCGSDDCCKLEGKAHREGLYKCRNKECRKQFTVTVGTIFHRSHFTLKQWLLGFHIMAASKKGVSALQLQRMLDIGSYKCAWHLAHRIRHVMEIKEFRDMLSGIVEVDETYVGGKVRGRGHQAGVDNKTAVLSLVERGGEGRKRSMVLRRVNYKSLGAAIAQHVQEGSVINTDEHKGYSRLKGKFTHHTVNHSEKEYVRKLHAGKMVTTNTVEGSFSLLKRGIVGAFHHISRKHLHRYLAEFDFRWNTRKDEDGERFVEALSQTPGKRLLYKDPIGAKA